MARLLILLAMTGLAQPAQPPPPAAATGGQLTARLLEMHVEQLQGRASYRRPPAKTWQAVTVGAVLRQGDTLVVDLGSQMKVTFHYRNAAGKQEPSAGVILKGFTELTVAKAFQTADRIITQLDVRQGIIRAGVRKTALAPSYRIRTPRVVVGVRGTEIARLEVSLDRGDELRMGRSGQVSVRDVLGAERQVAVRQITNDRLLRTIEAARLDRAINLLDFAATVREQRIAHKTPDRIDRNTAELVRSEGNAQFERVQLQEFPFRLFDRDVRDHDFPVGTVP